MEEKIARYYELKLIQKQVEEELERLRSEVLANFAIPTSEEIGSFKLTIRHQERREYDDHLLYQSLQDKEVWRLLSKADPAKISGLLKLNILSEEQLSGTYKIKQVPYIQVQKQ